jgi:hypothetical protein
MLSLAPLWPIQFLNETLVFEMIKILNILANLRIKEFLQEPLFFGLYRFDVCKSNEQKIF